MQIKDGATVQTMDGQDIGKVDRVVLDPRTNEVTHVVVRKGWLFTEDKVVPVELLNSASEDRILLRGDVTSSDDLPAFEETYHVARDEMPQEERATAATPAMPYGYAPGLYWYPPMGSMWAGYYSGSNGYPLPNYVSYTEQNIPDGTVAVKEGAEVYSADGERVGKVEEVITNAECNRATHLLISEGWLFKEKRVIPVDWIRDIYEERIELAVNARTLGRVPAHS